MDYWKFFIEAFSKMPSWVRVVTWFALLFLVVYLYVSPRFINGQMVVLLDNGGTVEYRGATLRTQVEGRGLKFKTNEDGYWSVPVVSRMPFQAIHLQVYHEDAKAWYDVDIDGATVWSSVLGAKEIRLQVSSNPPSVKQTVLAQRGRLHGLAQAVMRAAGSVAWAQQPEAEEAKAGKKQIASRLSAIIAKEAGAERSKAGPEYRLTGKGAPSYPQKLSIIKATEKEFSVKMPDEAWQAMSTAGDLAEYVYQEKQKTRRKQ